MASDRALIFVKGFKYDRIYFEFFYVSILSIIKRVIFVLPVYTPI